MGYLVFLCLVFASNIAYAQFSFNPQIVCDVSYSDNVFLDSVDEEYDLLTSLAFGIDLDLTGRKGGIRIAYRPTYATYTRFPEGTNFRHSADVSGWADIARNTRLELTDTYTRTEDPVSDMDTTVRRGREAYFTNTATISMVNRFGAEDVVDLRYVYYILENSDEAIEDSAYQQPSLLITYWFFPNRYGIELRGSYTTSEFEVSEDFEALDTGLRFTRRFGRHFDGYIEYGHVHTDFLDDGGDYHVYSPQVGFTWSERADTRLAAMLGYYYRDNAVGEDSDGISGSVDMAYQWTSGSSISVNGSVGYDQTYFGAENLGFNSYYDVSGNITHPLGRRLAGSLAAGYRRNYYTDVASNREDNLWRAEVRLAYQALPWLTFNLNYLHTRLHSNINENNYSENRGTVQVTLTPRQPVRF